MNKISEDFHSLQVSDGWFVSSPAITYVDFVSDSTFDTGLEPSAMCSSDWVITMGNLFVVLHTHNLPELKRTRTLPLYLQLAPEIS